MELLISTLTSIHTLLSMLTSIHMLLSMLTSIHTLLSISDGWSATSDKNYAPTLQSSDAC